MNSSLLFFDFSSNTPSNCGDVLDIEFSSKDLNWSGVILEKGNSPHFYPNNVYTPYFYFALALDKDLSWSAETGQGMQELKTSPGDIWINPPFSPFSHDISEPCYFVILAVEEKVFLDACSLNVQGKQLQFLNNYNVHDETIKGIMDLFLIEALAGGRNGKSYLNNMLSLLATHYIQNYSNFNDLLDHQSQSSKFDQAQVDKVDTYISANMGSPISVEDLAELIGCSKFYFLREFKKFMGQTPYQYLLSRRLEEAQSRLSESNGNIASIALDLGFNDQSHFSRAFKAHFGMTPKQYQNQ